MRGLELGPNDDLACLHCGSYELEEYQVFGDDDWDVHIFCQDCGWDIYARYVT